MKKIITWVLLLAMIVGLFAGCKKQDPTPVGDTPTVAQAMDYVKALYPNDPEPKKTPVDYERMGVVRINNVPFTVVWTTDLGEDQIKIVDNSDGTVTIDVNEQCEADTPYTLTATITGADGEKATHSWDYILPEAADMGEILKAAYALKSGESLPYESTLMGVVTVVKTPYDPSYKNITVIIEIAGYEDMPIECYRMKGEGIEEICIGDTITVTGTLKNYNGTIEFDAGCICERIVPGERVQAPEDMKQIVDEAYKLGANKSLPYEATLTGEIVEIGQPYDPSYKNITVTIAVEGREDKPIVCYRMKGDGCEKLKVTDIITVTGYITNYVGSKGHSTIEFTAGCLLKSYTPGVGVYAPTDPVEIMRIVKALGANQKTKFEAVLTGVITEINSPYSSQYDNISVTMDINGTYDEIYCYRIKGDGVSKIDVGDTITVKGYITNYVGDSGRSVIEYVAGSKLIKYVKGVKEELPSFNNIIADTLVAGQAYKLGQEQTNVAGSPWYYFNGKLANDFYLGTNENGKKAVDVFVAEVSGGYNLYYKDASGATKYINIVEVMGTDGKLHVNMDISSSAKTVYTFDADKKILTTMVGETAYCIGTYNNYTTMAARKVSGIEMPAYLLTLEELTGSATMDEAAKKLQKDYPDGYDADKKLPTSFEIRGEAFTVAWALETTNEAAAKIVDGVVVEAAQEQAVNYKLIATVTKSATGETTTVTFTHTVAPLPKDFVEEPVAGTAYKMGMYTPKGILLFNGKTESSSVTYRLASVNDSTLAANVYLEAVSGGYVLYFMDGETKTYINIYENQDGDPGYGKGSIELVTEKPTNVLTYDAAADTLVYTAPDGENKYFMGTYNTYTTFSVSNYSYIAGDKLSTIDVTQFPARFYPENIVVEPAPVIEPEKDTLTIPEALEFGASLDHNTYSNKKYSVTGEITEVYNATYGNLYIKDEAGNILTVYGTYSADGETRYDKLDVKPVAGDTITVYGIIGQYGGTPQMKNAWITEHVPVGGGTTDPDATEPEATEPEATEPEEPAENEIKLTVNSLGMTANSYSTSAATVNGVDFEWFELGYFENGIQMRTKNGNSLLWNTSAFNAPIKEIRLVCNSGKKVYNNPDAQIYSFGNAEGEFTHTTTLTTVADTYEYVITPDAETYTYFELEHTLGFTLYFDSITIVLADDGADVPEATEPEATEPEETVPEETEPSETTVLNAGDKIVIYAPAYNKALSTTKTGYNNYYNLGVDITVDGDVISGYAETEVWIVGVNQDGTYTFSNNGQLLSLNNANSSLQMDAENTAWNVIDLGNGLYNVQNVGRSNFLEWYDSKDNWSTYGTSSAATDPLFQLSFYIVEAAEPEVNDTLTIEEAIAMGAAMEHNTYTTDKYYVTGVITNVYNTMYGNMYITDEAGNQLKIYGTYSADGTIRYDGMDVKPVVGDTVTIYGVIGQYNGEAQIKDGWITEHIPGEGGTTDPNPTDPPAVEPEEPESTELKAGDKVVIYCPAYNKALSSTKTGFYNVGVDITIGGGVMTGYADSEIWTVGVNPDGTYTFSQNGQNIGLAGSYSSMNLGETNDDWTIVDLGNGLFTVQNVGRGNYLEWYNTMNNWSTYNTSSAATNPLCQMSFYIVEAAE